MCYITYSFIKRNEWGNPLFIIEWGEKMELLESIKEMVLPLIEQNDCYLDDIEYVKDNNEMYLRIYIEKNEGYLDMDTCVAVSELISDKLDETDPIKDEYILEVSSPGIEKPLKTFFIFFRRFLLFAMRIFVYYHMIFNLSRSFFIFF